MIPRIGLLGSGSQALEAAEYDPAVAVAFYAVPGSYLDPQRPDVIDLATTDPRLLATPVVAAVGAPGLRRELVTGWAGENFGSVISPSAWISPSAEIGEGAIVAPGVVVTAGAVIGRHVILNVGASVNHTSRIGDYSTLSPGVRIAGDCEIGAGVFLGIGATVSHGVRIAEGAVVGAGAVVVNDLDEAAVYAGVPVRRLRLLEDWIRRL